ncbi:hypothetical protein AA100600_2495 [Gluconobacter thailandicus F149-1 = NBRC 100600]|nr:hypothetical protein AA100600_2495 [Gluconobacter thailandicus F149-1 = NBRC 100600]
MTVALFTNENQLSVPPHTLQKNLGKKIVIKHDIGILHEMQCLEGKKIRITGTASHQPDLSGFFLLYQKLIKDPIRPDIISGKCSFSTRSIQKVFPDPFAVLNSRICP